MQNDNKDMPDKTIKAVIGLGNPGPRYYNTRHSIGFRIIDELAQRHGGMWEQKGEMELASINLGGKKCTLIKPQTYMNASGRIIPALLKKGIRAENILVVHDELELPFGVLRFKDGGSHRGHNGLRSIIEACGKEFLRLRFGTDRPEQREEVPHYVLEKFDQPEDEIAKRIEAAADMIEEFCNTH